MEKTAIESLRYYIDNPSAWQEGFDQGLSDAIRRAIGTGTTFQLPASLDLKGYAPTNEQVRCIAADPFYCLERVTPIYAERHRTLLTEEEFVELGVAFIEQHGPEEYIRTMLRDLKGEGAHMVPVPAQK